MTMRARNIKPGFFHNEDLALLTPTTQLLFIGLWLAADREGRLEDRPRHIRADVFPYEHGDSLDVHRELTVLEEAGFIRRYVVQGRRLIEVTNFKKHQSPHHTEKASILPGWDARDQQEGVPSQELASANSNPPLTHGEVTVNSPGHHGGNPPDSLIHRFSDSPIQNPSSELCSSDQMKAPQKKNVKEPSQEASKLAALLKSEIIANKSDYRITPAQERKWGQTADRMLRLDGRKCEEIADLIRWVQHNEFWMANVLSMDTLREKFDALQLKRGRTNGNGNADGSARPKPTEVERHTVNPCDIVRAARERLANRG
jgi:hypothetical protein